MGIRKQRRKVLRGVIVALAMAAIMLTGIVKIPKAEAGVVPVLQEYTITYNANGGGGAPSNQTKYQDQDLVLRTTKPWQEGYEFKGWSLTKDGAVAYQPGDTYKRNASATLYAVWARVSYTIKLNPVGGTVSPTTITKGYRESVTLPTPTRVNYKFRGWATSSTATDPTYEPGAKYSANSSVELWALWQWNPATYTVSFDANGGTGAPSSTTKVYGTVLTLPSTVPSRTGYDFLGWSESSTATTETYKAGGTYSENRAIKLYAVWKIKTYTITLCNNTGNDQNPGNFKQFVKTHGVPLLLSDTSDYLGKVFIGYDKDRKATTPTYPKGSYYTEDKAVTLFAIYKDIVYTITYYANSGGGAPSSQTKGYNQTITLSTTKPWREGYVFKGWSKTQNGAVAYQPGASYSDNANLSLYAVWDRVTYTITLNANGGSVSPTSITKGYSTAVDLPVPTRANYTFLGWDKSATATSPEYKPGDKYSANASATFYACWKLITYTVSYDANSGGGAPSSQVKESGKALTLSTTVPWREGYTFKGWSTTKNGTVAYQPGASYTANADVTLYAVWDRVSYTITLNANGGSVSPTSITKGYATAVDLPVPTRANYDFIGWDKSTSTTTPEYKPGNKYSTNASVTLYAQWQLTKYTVSYDANSGGGAPSAQVQEYGKSITLSTTRPWREGYVFTGWSTTKNGSVAYQPGDTYTVTGNATLYAVWDRVSYTITLNANGGSVSPTSITKGYSASVDLPVPTRANYKFVGWDKSPTATTPEYKPGDKYSANASAGLYAIWKWDPETYTISYDANGGTGAPLSHAKVYGTGTTLSTSIPQYEGHDFLGWSESSTATTATYKAGASYTENRAIKLYAVWKWKTYTVTLTNNSGNGSNVGSVLKLTKTYGVPLELPSCSDMEGCTFLGYDPSASATTPKYAKGAKYTENANATLYAVWNLAVYKISFDLNGGSGIIPSTINAKRGIAVQMPTANVSKHGYYFMGWAKSRDASVAQYKSTNTITVYADTTLYAVWEARTWTLTFNVNGGGGTLPDTVKAKHGTEATIGKSKMEREGYYFSGWSKSPTAETGEYKTNFKIVLTANTTLYAIWTKRTYYIAFDVNGGTGTPPATIYVKYQNNAVIPSTGISRDGYYFMGWSPSKGMKDTIYKSNDVIKSVSENITLYAVWEGKACTLKYDSNGVGARMPSDVQSKVGKSVKISGFKVEHQGYYFSGWAKSKTATKAEYTSQSYITLEGDTTLYAVWQKKKFMLYFDMNGLSGTRVKSIQAEYDTDVIIPSMSFQRDGYWFAGWSTKKEDPLTVKDAEYTGGSKFHLMRDTTLYAVWKHKHTYGSECRYSFSTNKHERLCTTCGKWVVAKADAKTFVACELKKNKPVLLGLHINICCDDDNPMSGRCGYVETDSCYGSISSWKYYHEVTWIDGVQKEVYYRIGTCSVCGTLVMDYVIVGAEGKVTQDDLCGEVVKALLDFVPGKLGTVWDIISKGMTYADLLDLAGQLADNAAMKARLTAQANKYKQHPEQAFKKLITTAEINTAKGYLENPNTYFNTVYNTFVKPEDMPLMTVDYVAQGYLGFSN